MKIIFLFILQIIFLYNFSIAQDSCKIKEVSRYNFWNKEDKVNETERLEVKLFFRKDGQLLKEAYYDSLGNIYAELFCKYNKQDKCILIYRKIDGIYKDSTQATYDREGKLIPLKQITFLSYFDLESTLKKIVYNKCDFPIKVVKYFTLRKRTIILKYKYKYVYW